jgi:hypothetical protein
MLDFLKRLFGGRRDETARAARPANLGEQLVAIQRAYWTPDADEKAALAARVDELGPAELLRLHHLACMDLLAEARRAGSEDELDDAPPQEGADLDLCRQLLPRLAGPGAPYRPRHAQIWQRGRGEPDREPDHDGVLLNASLTHAGALEIIRVEDTTPTTIDFLAFDAIRGIDVGPPSLFRPARVYLEGEPDPERFVPALLPLLYGPSWASPHEHDKDGSMTSFVCHLDRALGDRTLAVGLGHQDFTFADRGVVFGLGSVESIVFALEVSAPDFDARCRARGLDPDEVRRRFAKEE